MKVETRKKETTKQASTDLLYRVAKAMATVKDGRELLKIIVAETQPIFDFYDIGLTVFDKNLNVYVDWSVFYEDINPSAANFEQRELENFTFPADEPLMAYAIERFAAEGKPFIVHLDAKFIERFPDFPHLEIEIKHGYKQFLATTLQFGGETLGVLNFNGLRENQFDDCDFELFQAIADLVAVAVANIRANEEILKREREKSELLEITELIAQIKATDDLLRLIVQKIKPLFGFHDCGLFIISPDGQTHADLATPDISPSDWNGQIKYYLEQMPHHNSPVEWAIEKIEANNAPVIFDFKDLVERFPDYAQFKEINILELGYRDCLAANLTVRGQVVGMFCLNALAENFFSADVIPLFQAVSNNVSIAVANILANEEIIMQLAEIKELKKRLEAENVYLTEEVRKNYNFEEIIGTSPELQKVFAVIETVAPTDATVLIQGETGTGKELVARAVHNRSTRNSRPLIKINCAALPRELVESEFFGHERGSFTGAIEKRIGKFELASGGTIFLDEIGELPLEMQVKLLRVLQEKEIERLGGKGVIKLDLRVVAATNRNLAQEVQAGRFRADLYYRLCTVELFLPALRERKEDIEPLTMYFAEKYAAKFSRQIERISSRMLAELHAYDFPGNIRELEHIVEHAVIFSKNEKLILPRSLTGNVEVSLISNGKESPKLKSSAEPQTLSSIERGHIIEVLRQTSGRIKGKNGAAEILGLNPATLYFRMKKLGIENKRN